jgi:hypothetical protein
MLSVRYVDGTTVGTSPDRFVHLRPYGIDWVDLGAYRMQGQSVYWVRHGRDGWTVGGGTVVDVQEAVATDGGFRLDRPEFMPDLEHVATGWWLP